MSRGTSKTNSERIRTLIVKRTQFIEQIQESKSKLVSIDLQIGKLLNQQIRGNCQKLSCPFPYVESILDELKPDLALLSDDSELRELQITDEKDSVTELTDKDGEYKLTVRLTQKEKEQIYSNSRIAGYGSITQYARKMLLDGYVIQWEFDAINELSKEMAVVSRNMSQIVKRANVTNSIYEGDFQDFNNGWKKLQAAMLSTITTMRKLMMRE